MEESKPRGAKPAANRRRRIALAAGAVALVAAGAVAAVVLTRGGNEAAPPTTTAPQPATSTTITLLFPKPDAFYGGAAYFQRGGFGKNDFTHGDTVFPLGIWDGGPGEVTMWKNAGINLYVGQLYYEPSVVDAAAAAGLSVIGSEGNFANPSSATILGWRPHNVNGANNLWDDEPDLFKSDINRCTPPDQFDAHVQAMKKAQPTMPTLVNLGFTPLQAIGWFVQNRGIGCDGHDEDFARYTAHADIVSSDVYTRTVIDNGRTLPLTLVGDLVTRTRVLVGDTKPVCSVIEAADLDGDGKAITPLEMRFTVLHALIRGANCIIYFTIDANYSDPKRIQKTPQLLAEMTTINAALRAEARALNSPPKLGFAATTTDGIELLTKPTPEGDTLVMVAETTGKAQTATITFPNAPSAVVKSELGTVGNAVCKNALPLNLDAYGVAMFRVSQQPAAGCPA